MQENIHELFSKGVISNPHQFLGIQLADNDKQIIRIWKPGSSICHLEICGKPVEAKKIHDSGLYEYEVLEKIHPADYRVLDEKGEKSHDPYAFEQAVGELDLHLMQRGVHYELYNLLGSTPRVHQGIAGVHFAVWAPNAVSVSLIGEFNHWDGLAHPMRRIDSTGVWEIFMPGLSEGIRYKYKILTKEGKHRIKSDPLAHYSEMRPRNSSRVFNVNRFQWTDATWMQRRGKFRFGNAPINIYEVHLGSWQKRGIHFLNYRDLAAELVKYCKKMHFTHVEIFGICEHPLDESWGYQVTGYFSPTSRFGTPEDFQYFVDYLHAHDIGVILDWVPAHFPRDDHSLAQFDGTCLYEHMDPRQGYHPHWNTHIFNYGRFEVSNFLISSALFWLEKMHIDGLRVDAVASMLYLDYGRGPGEWIPNKLGTNINLEAVEFLKHLNSIVHQRFPDALVIAEESTTFPGVTAEIEKGGLGFDFKWNMGWMNDSLRFFSTDFSLRGNHLHGLSFIGQYVFSEKFISVLSHDEVVHGKKTLYGKMPGNEWEKLANLRLLLSYKICFPGKKLLFMGGEFGQIDEWNFHEEIHWRMLDNPQHKKLHQMVAALGAFYLNHPALYEKDSQKESFEWVIPCDEENSVAAYFRKGMQQILLCIHHFQPRSIPNYHIPLSEGSRLQEIFNTDGLEWGGSGIINPEVEIKEGFVTISLAPLATHIFQLHV